MALINEKLKWPNRKYYYGIHYAVILYKSIQMGHWKNNEIHNNWRKLIGIFLFDFDYKDIHDEFNEFSDGFDGTDGFGTI